MDDRTCSVDGCERPFYGRGWCNMHYKRWRNNGTTEKVRKRKTCKVDGCDSYVTGHGYCVKHYKRWRKHGDPLYEYVRERRRGVVPCAVSGCPGKVEHREWCSKHYNRWRRYGDPTARMRGEVVDGKKICPRCEIDKPLGEWGQTYCRLCTNAVAAEYRAKNPRPQKLALAWTCDYCGAPFEGDKRRRRYCSTNCAEANKHRANWPHLNARRARLRDAYIESFDRFEIFERDSWICGICGDPVDPATEWPHPLSASLDHIIPIARGGKHSRENAQCAHLTCNVRKGDAMA